MAAEEFHCTCNICKNKIPNGLSITNICIDCLLKPYYENNTNIRHSH